MKDLRIRVVPWSGVPAFRHTLSRSVALASTRDETRRRLSRVILPPWIFRVDPMEITLYREFLSFREGQVRKKKRIRNSCIRRYRESDREEGKSGSFRLRFPRRGEISRQDFEVVVRIRFGKIRTVRGKMAARERYCRL